MEILKKLANVSRTIFYPPFAIIFVDSWVGTGAYFLPVLFAWNKVLVSAWRSSKLRAWFWLLKSLCTATIFLLWKICCIFVFKNADNSRQLKMLTAWEKKRCMSMHTHCCLKTSLSENYWDLQVWWCCLILEQQNLLLTCPIILVHKRVHFISALQEGKYADVSDDEDCGNEKGKGAVSDSLEDPADILWCRL